MIIEVVPASIDDKPIVQRLMELYQYDFSEYEKSDVDSHGSFGYPFLDLYWLEPSRHPFLVRLDGKLAGFVLVNQNTYLPTSEWAISEFFIMRKYRKQGMGKAVAMQVFDRFRGIWEVHELDCNPDSIQFWRSVIASYTGRNYAEEQLDDASSRGPIQSFDNRL